MRMSHRVDRWKGALSEVPAGVRIMLTAFLAIMGAGYLVAVANIYHSHGMADGKEGLSIADVRAVYSGLQVAANEAIPSRMLTMIHGSMREYIDTDEDYAILEKWLTSGGSEQGLDEGEARKTPRRALMRNCLRCHAESTGTAISKEAPFGPDDFDVDYGMISKFVSVRTSESSENMVDVPPQYTLSRLVLISHVHMLAIPMFTLVVGLLFALTRLPSSWRAWLTPLPMLAVGLDFCGWWLSRVGGPFIYLILGAGALFGIVFGLQVTAIAVDLWWPRGPTASIGQESRS